MAYARDATACGGVRPKVAQKRFGHSTISTAMNLYSHVTDAMQADAAARLDTAFQIAKTCLKGQSQNASVAIWVALTVGKTIKPENNIVAQGSERWLSG